MPKRSDLLCLVLAFVFAATSFAQDDDKKAKAKEKQVKNVIKQLMKPFAKAELTDAQKEKATELITKHMDSFVAARKANDATLTAEQKKKRTAAVAKLKEEGAKGKEIWSKAMASVGLNEEQMKAYTESKKKVAEVQSKIHAGVIALLTDEQKKTLPKKMLAAAKGKGKGGKGKGKDKTDGGTQAVSLKLPNMT
jgi:hypothetical protein